MRFSIPMTVVVKLFCSVGNFPNNMVSLVILNLFSVLQKKAKEFRKSEARENVRAESYLASNEESRPKKTKPTKSK